MCVFVCVRKQTSTDPNAATNSGCQGEAFLPRKSHLYVRDSSDQMNLKYKILDRVTINPWSQRCLYKHHQIGKSGIHKKFQMQLLRPTKVLIDKESSHQERKSRA